MFPGKIAHYRVDFYKALSERQDIELSLAYFGKLPANADVLKCNLIPLNIFQVGPFQFNFDLLKYRSKFDLFVIGFNLFRLTNLLLFILTKKSFIWWGIGKGNNSFINRIRVKIISKSDGLITYMPKAMKWFIDHGISEDKLAFAGNTIHVRHPIRFPIGPLKTKILLLGSLNSRKEFQDVLFAFKKIMGNISNDISICVVGDGQRAEDLKRLSQQLQIEQRVNFIGRVTEEKQLKKIFEQALLSISPGQAGLSILHCFAFGVPFVAYEDAISGGELDNIISDHNGLLIKRDVNELGAAMMSLLNDRDKLELMSKNAFDYYNNERSLNKMVSNFMTLILKQHVQ